LAAVIGALAFFLAGFFAAFFLAAAKAAFFFVRVRCADASSSQVSSLLPLLSSS
jgi:hypothetical protein